MSKGERGQKLDKDDQFEIMSITTDEDASEVLECIFPSEEQAVCGSAEVRKKAVTLSNLDLYLDQWLHQETSQCDPSGYLDDDEPQGRLGQEEVYFQLNTNVGILVIDSDRLGLSSQSNFCSVRANSCVYKGKWMYEVMLGSKGVMQVGWCTVKCKFSQEEGVGDTKDSYAYDGSRQRKWNATTQRYGDAWYTGDVITCTIDCDEGSICFYRNGVSLGEAFNTVKLGPGYAYFPAVSLSLNENLRANFGATPLRYPVEGYSPLQSPPTLDCRKTELLIGCLEKVMAMEAEEKMKEKVHDAECIPQSNHGTLLLVAAHIFDKLAPYLKNAYVTEVCLRKLMLRLNDSDATPTHQPVLQLLDYMWTFMQSFEIKACLENLMMSLLSAYRFCPVTTDFRFAKMYLRLVLAIVKHQKTRKFLLEHELFEKIRFPVFMYIKPLDDAGLEQITPVVWWDSSDDDNGELDEEDEEKKRSYLKSCKDLSVRVEELESIQVEILNVLMYHKDLTDTKTSRLFFLEKFRKFLKEIRTNYLSMWPLPVSLCFFHRMVRSLRHYWDEFQAEDPARFVLSQDAYLPIQEFWSDSRDYFELPRCGGSMSHLNKVIGSEVNKAQGFQLSKDGKLVQKCESGEGGYPKTEMPSGNSLMEILHGVMLLYNVAAHKQLAKMNSLRDSMSEFVQSYKDTLKKIESCPPEMTEVREELIRAKDVFLTKITEQTRQMSWVRAVIYSKAKQDDLVWLLKVAMKTVEKGSEFKILFQYMPELCLEIVLQSFTALRNYFHPIAPFNEHPAHGELLNSFANFLVSHFADSRIVVSDTRDSIIQALACFTCYEQSLKILENLPPERCQHMIKCLISPYENRSWAQTNWILVRIWKGCGFGFRYTHLPHLVPSKVQLTEFGSASLQPPCPSLPFQTVLAAMLQEETELATRFLDTLLNQLNWSFSEFIGIMQEIQQAISRTERRMPLETRQLKICQTCFEISVCLFRVVEMVVSIAPCLLLDWSKPSAELLLHRLIQLICLVLNRVTLKSGMFDSVVSLYITGLESVTHYPVLSVIAGILTSLMLDTTEDSQSLVTDILLSDPGFQMSTVQFMLANQEGSTKPASSVKKDGLKDKTFDFRNYTEVSEEEISRLQRLLQHLKKKQETFVHVEQEIKEEDMCKICYAHSQSATFSPCGHQSCRSCISHQLLIKKECFFCKAVISSITDSDGNEILKDTPSKR